jgi:hypothetical protein
VVGLEPAAKPGNVVKGINVLWFACEGHYLDLDRYFMVRLHSYWIIGKGPCRRSCIDVLINARVVDREVRVGAIHLEGTEGSACRTAICGVVNDAEGSITAITARSTADGSPDRKRDTVAWLKRATHSLI